MIDDDSNGDGEKGGDLQIIVITAHPLRSIGIAFSMYVYIVSNQNYVFVMCTSQYMASLR